MNTKRATILSFIVRTQKATAAALMGATALASATFIPAPYSLWAASAVVVLTWLVTYVVPFVAKAVEAFPEEQIKIGNLDEDRTASQTADPEPADLGPEPEPEVLTGEIIEPESDVIEIPVTPTVGIPVFDQPSTAPFVPPFTGAIRVEDVLARLAEERTAASV
jgi:hypothetical protein